MRTIKVEIKGNKYLMHKFVEATKGKSKTQFDAKEDAENGTYKTKGGKYFVPNTQIEATLSRAATNFRVKGRKTYKDIIKSMVVCEPEEILMEPQNYEVFSCPVVIQRARIMRSRAKFADWKLKFNLIIKGDDITPSTLKEILIEAGKFNGIGDWRPKYGTFEVTKFEEVR